jgi:hypothetical protein
MVEVDRLDGSGSNWILNVTPTSSGTIGIQINKANVNPSLQDVLIDMETYWLDARIISITNPMVGDYMQVVGPTAANVVNHVVAVQIQLKNSRYDVQGYIPANAATPASASSRNITRWIEVTGFQEAGLDGDRTGSRFGRAFAPTNRNADGGAATIHGVKTILTPAEQITNLPRFVPIQGGQDAQRSGGIFVPVTFSRNPANIVYDATTQAPAAGYIYFELYSTAVPTLVFRSPDVPSSSYLTNSDGDAFTLTPRPAVPERLVITKQPAVEIVDDDDVPLAGYIAGVGNVNITNLEVEVRDRFGNLVTTQGGNINISPFGDTEGGATAFGGSPVDVAIVQGVARLVDPENFDVTGITNAGAPNFVIQIKPGTGLAGDAVNQIEDVPANHVRTAPVAIPPPLRQITRIEFTNMPNIEVNTTTLASYTPSIGVIYHLNTGERVTGNPPRNPRWTHINDVGADGEPLGTAPPITDINDLNHRFEFNRQYAVEFTLDAGVRDTFVWIADDNVATKSGKDGTTEVAESPLDGVRAPLTRMAIDPGSGTPSNIPIARVADPAGGGNFIAMPTMASDTQDDITIRQEARVRLVFTIGGIAALGFDIVKPEITNEAPKTGEDLVADISIIVPNLPRGVTVNTTGTTWNGTAPLAVGVPRTLTVVLVAAGPHLFVPDATISANATSGYHVAWGLTNVFPPDGFTLGVVEDGVTHAAMTIVFNYTP